LITPRAARRNHLSRNDTSASQNPHQRVINVAWIEAVFIIKLSTASTLKAIARVPEHCCGRPGHRLSTVRPSRVVRKKLSMIQSPDVLSYLEKTGLAFTFGMIRPFSRFDKVQIVANELVARVAPLRFKQYLAGLCVLTLQYVVVTDIIQNSR
jgi:hypothetical protein